MISGRASRTGTTSGQGLLKSGSRREQHPKIAATVERATALWLSGQKCLIFCWFIRTTGALQGALRNRLDSLVQSHAAQALGLPATEVTAELERISNRLLKSDSTNYERIRKHLNREFDAAVAGRRELAEALTRIAVRNLRTPAYLIRYANLSMDLDAEGLLKGVAGENPTGTDLLRRWTEFAERMAAMTSDERTKVLARLQGEPIGTPASSSNAQAASTASVPSRSARRGTSRSTSSTWREP
jgi:hypothetical protein